MPSQPSTVQKMTHSAAKVEQKAVKSAKDAAYKVGERAYHTFQNTEYALHIKKKPLVPEIPNIHSIAYYKRHAIRSLKSAADQVSQKAHDTLEVIERPFISEPQFDGATNLQCSIPEHSHSIPFSDAKKVSIESNHFDVVYQW
jgi:hypothetical protein